MTMQVIDADFAAEHPQEGESRLFLNKLLDRFAPTWERIFRSEQSSDDEMQTAQNSKEKSTSPNGEEAAKFGFKKKQDEELDEEQQRAEEIEMEKKLRKTAKSDEGEKWCEETTELIELMPSKAFVSVRENNDRSTIVIMSIQMDSPAKV